MSPPRVVITGLGFVTPLGNDRAAVTSSLREQRHGLSPVAWFPDCPVRLAGTIRDFDVASFNRLEWRWPAAYQIARETLRSLAPHGLYAHCALLQAIGDAGLPSAALSDGDTGLFCASAGSPRTLRQCLNDAYDSGGQRVHPMGVVASISGTLNFNLAAAFGIRGVVTGFVSACAASTHALGYAHDEIVLGRQRRMLVVGAEEPVWESLLPFAGMRALTRQAEPRLASRPFDRQRLLADGQLRCVYARQTPWQNHLVRAAAGIGIPHDNLRQWRHRRGLRRTHQREIQRNPRPRRHVRRSPSHEIRPFSSRTFFCRPCLSSSRRA